MGLQHRKWGGDSYVDVEMSLVDFSLSHTLVCRVGVLWPTYWRRWSTLLEASTSTISHRCVWKDRHLSRWAWHRNMCGKKLVICCCVLAHLVLRYSDSWFVVVTGSTLMFVIHNRKYYRHQLGQGWTKGGRRESSERRTWGGEGRGIDTEVQKGKKVTARRPFWCLAIFFFFFQRVLDQWAGTTGRTMIWYDLECGRGDRGDGDPFFALCWTLSEQTPLSPSWMRVPV